MQETTLSRSVSGDRNSDAAEADKTLATLPELYAQLRTSENGLSTEEASKRLEQFGPNDPTAVRGTGILKQLLTFVVNPLVAILLIASIVSATLGEVVNAFIIILMVLLSVALNFFQTFRSQRTVERLRAGVALTATVLRDGRWVELPRRELVPGDSIRLRAGDLVPADARLVEVNGLHVQQAALTGESMPVEKIAQERAAAPLGYQTYSRFHDLYWPDQLHL